MVPLNVFICIIVVQCVVNLLGIWVLSNETKKKDKVIAKMSEELSDKAFLIRTYKRLLDAKEKKMEVKCDTKGPEAKFKRLKHVLDVVLGGRNSGAT